MFEHEIVSGFKFVIGKRAEDGARLVMSWTRSSSAIWVSKDSMMSSLQGVKVFTILGTQKKRRIDSTVPMKTRSLNLTSLQVEKEARHSQERTGCRLKEKTSRAGPQRNILLRIKISGEVGPKPVSGPRAHRMSRFAMENSRLVVPWHRPEKAGR
jgi:hypothetical protein